MAEMTWRSAAEVGADLPVLLAQLRPPGVDVSIPDALILNGLARVPKRYAEKSNPRNAQRIRRISP